jgi:hypothetical protein
MRCGNRPRFMAVARSGSATNEGEIFQESFRKNPEVPLALLQVVDYEAGRLERAKGFEPSTSTLARLRSTRLSYARIRQERNQATENFRDCKLCFFTEMARPDRPWVGLRLVVFRKAAIRSSWLAWSRSRRVSGWVAGATARTARRFGPDRLRRRPWDLERCESGGQPRCDQRRS